MMRFGSVCSGIEAASAAWGPLGWRAAWLSEIEPFPAAVLAHHYPDVHNLGDMTALPSRILSGEVEAPDVLCGGTPCQAFSVAGKRESLDDARGNLSLVFCDIANAIDTVRGRLGRPKAIIVWENVPGVLNTKDNAFGCFLAGLAGENSPLEPAGGKWTNAGYVLGPKRAVAWRVTDAQYFGVAQRRRRVFVVASAREGFDPAAVLFEFEGVRRDSAPSREAGQGAAGGIARSVALRGREGGGTIELGDDVGGCLRASSGGGDKPHVITLAHGQGGAEIGFDRGPTLTCIHEAPIAAYANAGYFGSMQEVSVSDPLRAKGGDTGNGGESLIAAPYQNVSNSPCAADGKGANGQHADDHKLIPVGVTIHGTDPTVQKVASYDEIAQCLRARTPGNIDNSSTTVVQHPVCVTGDITHTLKAEGFDASEDGTGRGQPIIAVHGTQDPDICTEHAHPLGRNSGQENAIAFAQNTRDEVRLMGGDGQIVGALAAEPGMKRTCYVAQPVGAAVAHAMQCKSAASPRASANGCRTSGTTTR